MLEPIIKVNDIKVIYNEGKSNEYVALRGESLEIFPGEYIILFGPSGCGKSTLLYSILGILEPTGGELLVNGDNVYKYSSKRMVQFQQETIGIIYQSFNMIPSLSVIDNIALPLIFAGVRPAEREQRALALLRRFGVEKQAYKLSTNLSGGQVQRIAVARSLINNPQILLADEPVGNLDSVSSDEVMGTLSDINSRDKKTIILVTHDAKFLPYAHRTYFMKDGGVQREVINPEKKQIKSVKPGTTILTEVEKLARVYPYASIDELKVKSIINYVIEDIGFDQMERIEKTVQSLIEGRLLLSDAERILVSPLAKGGAEVRPEVATEIVRKTQNILDQARDVRHYRNRLHDKFVSTRQTERLIGLRRAVLDEYQSQVSHYQVEWLDVHIASRISGLISMEDFRDQLSMSAEQKGGGFSRKDARSISRYLEKLIAQGLHL